MSSFTYRYCRRGKVSFLETSIPTRAQCCVRLSDHFTFTNRDGSILGDACQSEYVIMDGNSVVPNPGVAIRRRARVALKVVSEDWRGAMKIIDPSDHEEGQKLTFERHQTIGQPRPVLPSLVYVNGLPDAPKVIDPKPIFKRRHFGIGLPRTLSNEEISTVLKSAPGRVEADRA